MASGEIAGRRNVQMLGDVQKCSVWRLLARSLVSRQQLLGLIAKRASHLISRHSFFVRRLGLIGPRQVLH